MLNPGSFAANPDGRSTAFTLFIKTMAQESGSGGNVEFAALHGATDAPTVDIVARGVATLVDNAAYGDITSYLSVPPAKYLLDVKDSSGTVRVATFSADLSGAGEWRGNRLRVWLPDALKQSEREGIWALCGASQRTGCRISPGHHGTAPGDPQRSRSSGRLGGCLPWTTAP